MAIIVLGDQRECNILLCRNVERHTLDSVTGIELAKNPGRQVGTAKIKIVTNYCLDLHMGQRDST